MADHAPPPPIEVVTRALTRACKELADAGNPAAAAECAAQGWAALRMDEPRLAERLNGVMHHIARVESRLEGAPQADQGAAHAIDHRTPTGKA